MRPLRLDTRLGGDERIALSCWAKAIRTCSKHSVDAMLSLIGDSPALGEELSTEMAMIQHMRSADPQNTYGQLLEFRRLHKAGAMHVLLRSRAEPSERSAGARSYAPSSAGDASAPKHITRSTTRDQGQIDQWRCSGWRGWRDNGQSWAGWRSQHKWDDNDTHYQK